MNTQFIDYMLYLVGGWRLSVCERKVTKEGMLQKIKHKYTPKSIPNLHSKRRRPVSRRRSPPTSTNFKWKPNGKVRIQISPEEAILI